MREMTTRDKGRKYLSTWSLSGSKSNESFGGATSGIKTLDSIFLDDLVQAMRE